MSQKVHWKGSKKQSRWIVPNRSLRRRVPPFHRLFKFIWISELGIPVSRIWPLLSSHTTSKPHLVPEDPFGSSNYAQFTELSSRLCLNDECDRHSDDHGCEPICPISTTPYARIPRAFGRAEVTTYLLATLIPRRPPRGGTNLAPLSPVRVRQLFPSLPTTGREVHLTDLRLQRLTASELSFTSYIHWPDVARPFWIFDLLLQSVKTNQVSLRSVLDPCIAKFHRNSFADATTLVEYRSSVPKGSCFWRLQMSQLPQYCRRNLFLSTVSLQAGSKQGRRPPNSILFPQEV